MPTAFERALERAVPAVIEETVRVAEIPAPTFQERARARNVDRRVVGVGGGPPRAPPPRYRRKSTAALLPRTDAARSLPAPAAESMVASR